jgi:predicted phage terminase large subunit-like protein
MTARDGDANARRALARRDLCEFGFLVYPRFAAPPHIRLIADLLEAAERGQHRAMMISVPVRHGKSVLCSQLFPAWYIGRHPEQNVILASHSEELATRNSRVAKHLVEDARWPFDVQLSTDSTSAGRWDTKQGGGCYAIGVGGGITGRGANCLIIDDALHDGLSSTERDAAFRWYSEVAIPRLEPGGVVIVIGARFSSDDLHGKILESEDGPNFHVINLPAIGPDGKALWPERIDVPELEQRRVAMGSIAFAAQFQQDPLPADGQGMFKSAWFDRRFDALPDLETTVFGLDTAWKLGPQNDESACVRAGMDKRGNIYIIDAWHEQLLYPDLKDRVRRYYDAHNPAVIGIEDAASGQGLVEEFIRDQPPMRVKRLKSTDSKESRAAALSVHFENSKVFINRTAPWFDAYRNQFLRFNPRGSGASNRFNPRGSGASNRNDLVDATELAVRALQKTGTTFFFGGLSNGGPR